MHIHFRNMMFAMWAMLQYLAAKSTPLAAGKFDICGKVIC